MINRLVVRRDNNRGDPGHLWSWNVQEIIPFWGIASSLLMKRPTQVEAARELMIEAMKWSVMKWLREKKNVRKTADQANAALDKLNREVKERWPSSVIAAYNILEAQSSAVSEANGRQRHQSPRTIEPQASVLAKKMKEANDDAYHAREVAEKAFDDAEKQLSTRLAREGCLKAIQAWDMLEEAIRKGEDILHE